MIAAIHKDTMEDDLDKNLDIIVAHGKTELTHEPHTPLPHIHNWKKAYQIKNRKVLENFKVQKISV